MKDLNSKFGTFINGSKIPPNENIQIEKGKIITFGALGCKIKISRCHLSFCMTRLEKQDKDRLKANVKAIGGKIVNKPEQATHIVANKAAATIKMLTAIVMNLKIITGEWLNFSATIRSTEIIPSEEE